MRIVARSYLMIFAVVALLLFATAPPATEPVAASPKVSPAAPDSSPDLPSREEAIAKERYGIAEVALPSRTIRHADGTVEIVADPAAVRALTQQASLAGGDACGSACDGKDPASFLAPMPGGPSNYRYCSTDAQTIYIVANGESRVELRYSPGCRTAWSRGCCYRSLKGYSYYPNGNERLNVLNWHAKTSGTNEWTAMLDDAGYTYSACRDRQIGGSPDWHCTSRW